MWHVSLNLVWTCLFNLDFSDWLVCIWNSPAWTWHLIRGVYGLAQGLTLDWCLDTLNLLVFETWLDFCLSWCCTQWVNILFCCCPTSLFVTALFIYSCSMRKKFKQADIIAISTNQTRDDVCACVFLLFFFNSSKIQMWWIIDWSCFCWSHSIHCRTHMHSEPVSDAFLALNNLPLACGP